MNASPPVQLAPVSENAPTTNLETTAVVTTPEFIRQQCKKHQGYTTPELNEKLYLHHLNIDVLAHLEPYTGCRVLYAQQNFISDVSPLACLGQSLRSLYIANNCLRSLSSVPPLPHLELLDASDNQISQLDDLSHRLPALETLLLGKNSIQHVDAASLAGLARLTSLDLTRNRLESDADVLDAVVARRDSLRTLVLTGNKCTQRSGHYRKRFIHALPELRYLDELPVFLDERTRAAAFAEGGSEAELRAKRDLAMKEAATREEQFRFFEQVREPARARRESGGKAKLPPSAYLLAQRASIEADEENDSPIYIPPC